MNENLILRIPAFLCVIFLCLHSYRFLGKKRTFIIFCIGFFIFFLFAKSEQSQPEYIVAHPIKFFGVPVLLPAGWIFTTYCSFFVATSVLTLFPKKKDSVFMVLAVSLVCVACIALAMEVTGTHAGWWKWNLKPGEKGPIAMVGWMLHTMAFYPWFLLLFCTKYRRLSFFKKAAILFLLSYLVRRLSPFFPIPQHPVAGTMALILIMYLSIKNDALKMEDTFHFK